MVVVSALILMYDYRLEHVNSRCTECAHYLERHQGAEIADVGNGNKRSLGLACGVGIISELEELG